MEPYVASGILLVAGLGLQFVASTLKKVKTPRLTMQITLVRTDTPVAPDPIGFAVLGHFSCPEIGGLRLSAWWSDEHCLSAIAYQHPARGIWWDAVSYYPEGVTVTCSSMAGTGLDQDPRHPNLHFPGLALAQLVQESLQIRPAGFLPIKEDQFALAFCRSYADSMEWRVRRGTTAEEIKRVAAARGVTYSEEVLALAHKLQKQAEERARRGEATTPR